MRLFYLFILTAVLLNAQTVQELREKALSKGLTSMPLDFKQLVSEVDDPDNLMSVEKIYLGKKLFFDKNLSKDRTIACVTCHKLDEGGVDGKPTAIGYHKLPNPSHLNSPTVLNTAYSKHFFWDGRVNTLREQAQGPTVAPFEMASSAKLIEERMNENEEYVRLFNKLFAGKRTVTFGNMAKAIETYEKTLITRGDFDEFLDGNDSALSEDAQIGLNMFIDIGCKGCHFGAAVGGQKIQKFPLRDYNSWLNITFSYDEKTNTRGIADVGLNFEMYHSYPFENRGGFMGKDGNQLFRVPILRNIAKTKPYFHNGVVKDLREALFLMGRHQVGVDMTERQLDYMEAFMKSLNGELVDYNLSR